MGRRVGLVRFDSDCGFWCFDEECQIQSLEEGGRRRYPHSR